MGLFNQCFPIRTVFVNDAQNVYTQIFWLSVSVVHAFLSMPATTVEELKKFYFTAFGLGA